MAERLARFPPYRLNRAPDLRQSRRASSATHATLGHSVKTCPQCPRLRRKVELCLSQDDQPRPINRTSEQRRAGAVSSTSTLCQVHSKEIADKKSPSDHFATVVEVYN